MLIELSDKEVRVLSAICAVAAEVARERLGEESCGSSWLLSGLPEEQLRDLIRIGRALEKQLDAELGLIELRKDGVIDVLLIRPEEQRKIREMDQRLNK